jgi:hypothetical protein
MSRAAGAMTSNPSSERPWWQPVVLASLAGGMGWGIRGQYGHESGAMIAGVLVGLCLVFLFCAKAPLEFSGRAVAWFTVAIGFGGSMTYGQTIGLTQDAPLVGHWDALRWGMLGLAVKGGIWIGFAGAFLGMGLGGVRYRSGELLVLMAGLLALFFAGQLLLNEPFDPAHRILPRIYFSDDWKWEPGAELKPRREVWGGLVLALAGVLAYTRFRRGDGLAWRLGWWGIAGGSLGFPLGQCVQAYHAWNLEAFRSGWWAQYESIINWWNMMETTFGATFGALLGLGLWLNRHRIVVPGPERPPTEPRLPYSLEWLLVGVHVSLLVVGEFRQVRVVGPVADLGLAMGVIPIVASAAGRWWPFLLTLPITLLPIAGKTIRQLCYREPVIAPWAGWLTYGVCAMLLMSCLAWWGVRQSEQARESGPFVRVALLSCVWTYFTLNFAFFRFPWVWETWTSRTPNGIIYMVCALGLTAAALALHRVRPLRQSQGGPISPHSSLHQ